MKGYTTLDAILEDSRTMFFATVLTNKDILVLNAVLRYSSSLKVLDPYNWLTPLEKRKEKVESMLLDHCRYGRSFVNLLSRHIF